MQAAEMVVVMVKHIGSVYDEDALTVLLSEAEH